MNFLVERGKDNRDNRLQLLEIIDPIHMANC